MSKNTKKSTKDYMKKLKKEDPEFFKAIIKSKEVLEGTGYSDEEFEDDFSEENGEDEGSFDEDDSVDERDEDEEEDAVDEDEEEDAVDEDESVDEEEEDSLGEEEEDSLGEEEGDSLDEGSVEEEDYDVEVENVELNNSTSKGKEAIKRSKKGSKNVISSDSDDDNEDYEPDDDDISDEEVKDTEESQAATSGKITKSMVKQWKKDIKKAKTSLSAFKCAEQALAAAILSIKGSEDNDLHSRYTVEGPQMFNLIVQFCLSDVAPALQKLFDLKTLSDRPARNSKWKKLVLTSTSLKRYMKHIIMLTKSITDKSGIELLLRKGILPILPFYVELPALGWNLVKHMITLWCTSFEKIRVLSLVAIFRLMRSFKEDLREKCLKALYMSYVKNCHFTSPISWPMINFMRMSLVELYSLDQALAYRHAFIYIRQLALHLRNALLVQKKERVQLVYNWQFIHCIRLWAELLGKTHPSKVLQPLIYPLVQISVGTIGLMKTPKYFPLVFHVCNILTELSNSTSTFIPIMPPLLEILSSNRILTRPKKTSVKPLQWDSIIKVSSAQLNESAFTDGIIDQVYDCLLTYLDVECSSIGFPELVFIASQKIKIFVNKCRVTSYSKKMKQLLEKIRENSAFIEQQRKDVQFGIADLKAIKVWEIATLQSSPPVHTFYVQYRNLKLKNAKVEQSFSNYSESSGGNPEADEVLLKEKLVKGAKKDVGSHLLAKRDKEDVEDNMEEEEDIPESSAKRKESSSDGSVVQPVKKRKVSNSNSDEDQSVDDDVVKVMKLSDDEESSADDDEDDGSVESKEDDDNGSSSENDDGVDEEEDEE